MATKKKFTPNLLEEDMVGMISGRAEMPAPQPAPVQPAEPKVVYVEVPKARRTEDPRVAFGISLKGSLKRKVEMSAVVKRTNASQVIADALNEYFDRHSDLLQKYEKMEQLGLLD